MLFVGSAFVVCSFQSRYCTVLFEVGLDSFG